MKYLKEYLECLDGCVLPGEYKIYFNENEFIHNEIKLLFTVMDFLILKKIKNL